MRAGGIVGGQAPQVVAVTRAIPLLVLLGTITAGVQRQGIAAAQRTNIVQVDILALEYIFHIRGIQRCTDIVIELIAATQYLDGLQTTAVTTGIALTVLSMETTGMYGQAVDFIGGEHGAGKGFRQQTAVVMTQHRQGRKLIAIAQHCLGKTCFERNTRVSHIALDVTKSAINRILLVRIKEIDTTITSTTTTTIQAITIKAEGINTETYDALSKARVEVQAYSLTPLSSVGSTLVVVTIDISITQEQISTAVLDKALGIRLAGSESGYGGHQGQCNGAQFVFGHFGCLDAVLIGIGSPSPIRGTL